MMVRVRFRIALFFARNRFQSVHFNVEIVRSIRPTKPTAVVMSLRACACFHVDEKNDYDKSRSQLVRNAPVLISLEVARHVFQSGVRPPTPDPNPTWWVYGGGCADSHVYVTLF